jgi:hypothetical protein
MTLCSQLAGIRECPSSIPEGREQGNLTPPKVIRWYQGASYMPTLI